MRYAFVFWAAGFLAILGCQSRPIQELALADVAMKAAQKAKADALAPDQFRKAENNYLRSKRDFQEGYFDSARKYANEARQLAEQAEYRALLKQLNVKGKPAELPPTPDDPTVK